MWHCHKSRGITYTYLTSDIILQDFWVFGKMVKGGFVTTKGHGMT